MRWPAPLGNVRSGDGERDGHPDVVRARRSSDLISAEAMAGSAGTARARSKSRTDGTQARQPPRRGTVSRTA